MNYADPKKELQKVLSLLLMRFKLPPYRSMSLIEDWLKIHTEDSYSTLGELLLIGGVIFQDGGLEDVYPEEIKALVIQMRGTKGVERKDRWYNFKVYRQCFVGSEAVEWITETQKVTKEEAIELGQRLIDYQIIHHVLNEHPFRDGYFFYRFYVDES